MNTRAILTVGGFFAAVALAGFFAWPLWLSIQELRNDTIGIPSLERKVEELQRENAKIGAFAQTFQDISDTDKERVFSAIPRNLNQPELLVQFEALTRRNGLVLTTINMTAAPQRKGEVLREAQIRMNLKGPSASLFSLLDDLEQSLRIMDIQRFSFVPATEGSGKESPGFSVEVSTYFIP